MSFDYRLEVKFMHKESESVRLRAGDNFTAIMMAGQSIDSRHRDDITSIKITYIEQLNEPTPYVVPMEEFKHYMLIN